MQVARPVPVSIDRMLRRRFRYQRATVSSASMNDKWIVWATNEYPYEVDNYYGGGSRRFDHVELNRPQHRPAGSLVPCRNVGVLLGFVAVQVAAKTDMLMVWRRFDAPQGVMIDGRGNPCHPQWGAGHCQWRVTDTVEAESLMCLKRHVFIGDAGGRETRMEALCMY